VIVSLSAGHIVGPAPRSCLRWVSMHAVRLFRSALRGLLALTVCAGCTGGDEATSPRPADTSVSASPTTEERTGLIDIDGRSLYLSCTGQGTPTVVYLHGLGGTHANAGAILAELGTDVRVCTYDRANVGRSDQQVGRHTVADSAEDLRLLLDRAEIAGPYVLLGASFGGLLAIQYAAMYPDDVVGLVLLDAALPAHELVDQVVPENQRSALIAAGDENQERVDLYESSRETQAVLNSVPDVPVTYLAAAIPQFRDDWSQEAIDAVIRQHQQAFVGRFSQGRLEIVDAPHHMEPVIPDKIVAETRRVIQLAR
jgi:pimeloyl-ACP methyl ester carboxylesterase